jgi:hypothetical protein
VRDVGVGWVEFGEGRGQSQTSVDTREQRIKRMEEVEEERDERVGCFD